MEPNTKKLTGRPSTSSISTDWNARISASTITVTMVGVSTGMVTWRSVPKTLLPATVDASSNVRVEVAERGREQHYLNRDGRRHQVHPRHPPEREDVERSLVDEGNRSISWLITP